MKATLLKIKKWYDDIPDVKYNIVEKVIFGIAILFVCGDIFYAWALSLDTLSIDNRGELFLLGGAFTLLILLILLSVELSATYRALKKALKVNISPMISRTGKEEQK